ncbi:MAG: gamma-glutamylcyclotransferase [SAR324 cluster bacterium]|nr:gamma-glutamylcyclotransferase [SAR324 cluster bacterium]
MNSGPDHDRDPSLAGVEIGIFPLRLFLTVAMPIYFAFGSNLHPPQMAERCPGSRLLRPGVLKGYRLAFTGYSTRWKGGVATVVADPSSEVQGLLYDLTEEDQGKLDRFEGFPTVYARLRVSVEGRDGNLHAAMTYQKQSNGATAPSLRYFHQIWKAYRAFQLDEAFLLKAVEDALDGNFEPMPEAPPP